MSPLPRLRRISRAPFASLLFLLVTALPALGETITWTGAVDGNWSNAANWSPPTVPASGDDVVIPAAAVRDVTAVTSAVSLNSITFGRSFSNARFSLDSGLTITNGAVVKVAIDVATNNTWDVGSGTLQAQTSVAAGATLSIAASSGTVTMPALTGSGDVVMSGGQLVLGTSNLMVQTTFSGTIEADDVYLVRDFPAATVVAASLIGSGRLKSLTVTERLGSTPSHSVSARAVDVALIGSPGTPVVFEPHPSVAIAYSGSLTLSHAALSTAFLGSAQSGRSFTLVEGAQPATGTFDGLPEGAAVTVGERMYEITYRAGRSGNDIALLWLGTTADRVWRGTVDGLWSRPENWSPAGIPAPNQSLIFPASGTVFETTNDLPTLSIPHGQLSFSAAYTVSGNALLLAGGVAGPATISADVQLAAAQQFRDATFQGSVDVHGQELTVLQTTFRGPVNGTGTIYGSARFESPTNGYSGKVSSSSSSPYSGPLYTAHLAGSLPAASFQNANVLVEGEQTIGNATLAGKLSMNHPAGPAQGRLNTGSLKFVSHHAFGGVFIRPVVEVDLDGAYSDEIVATGTVNLSGAWIETVAHRPVSIGDAFLIIRNDSADPVVGGFYPGPIFAPLAEGEEFDQPAGTFRITYQGGNGNDVILTATEPIPVTITPSNATVVEGDSGQTMAHVPLTLSVPAPAAITVVYETNDYRSTNTAERTDYEHLFTHRKTIIPAGATSATLTIPVYGDTIQEGSEQFAVYINYAGRATLAERWVNVTIIDNDDPRPLLSGAHVTEPEGSGGARTVTIPLSLSRDATAPTAVHYRTVDRSARAGEDYTATSGVVTIPAGSRSGEIVVSVVGDALVEPDEQFAVEITSTDAQTTEKTLVVTLTNDDSDQRPFVSGANVAQPEGSGGARTVTIPLSLSRDATSPTAVHYRTVDGSARAGEDYTATSGVVTIPAGSRSGEIVVTVVGDTTVEPDEQFAVEITSSDARTTEKTLYVTLTNDDAVPPPVLTGEDASTTERNAGARTVTVPLTLSRPASSPIVVQYHTEDRTARAGEDYSAAFGSVTIPAGADSASIAVTVFGDRTVEADEELVVVIDSAGNAEMADRELAVTILNDDVSFVRSPAIVYSGTSTLEVLRPTSQTAAVPAVVAFITAADENVVARQTTRGYAVVVVSLRPSFPDNVTDARAALTWLRANGQEHGIDAQRLAVWGIGAGGNVAALLGTNALGGATGVDAVVDWYGETDYVELDERPGACAMDYASLFGCDPAVCRDKARSASPMEYVSSDDAPFLIVHGTADCAVPASQSTRLRDALVNAGVAATFVSVPGGNHGGDAFSEARVLEAVDAFLDQHLAAPKTPKQRAVRR